MRAAGCPGREIPEEAIVVFPVVIDQGESKPVPFRSSPGAKAGTPISGVQDGSLAPKHPRHCNQGNPRASSEFRKPTTLGKRSAQFSWTGT